MNWSAIRPIVLILLALAVQIGAITPDTKMAVEGFLAIHGAELLAAVLALWALVAERRNRADKKKEQAQGGPTPLRGLGGL